MAAGRMVSEGIEVPKTIRAFFAGTVTKEKGGPQAALSIAVP